MGNNTTRASLQVDKVAFILNGVLELNSRSAGLPLYAVRFVPFGVAPVFRTKNWALGRALLLSVLRLAFVFLGRPVA